MRTTTIHLALEFLFSSSVHAADFEQWFRHPNFPLEQYVALFNGGKYPLECAKASYEIAETNSELRL